MSRVDPSGDFLMGVRSTGPEASSNRWAKLVPRVVRTINAEVEAKGFPTDQIGRGRAARRTIVLSFYRRCL